MLVRENTACSLRPSPRTIATTFKPIIWMEYPCRRDEEWPSGEPRRSRSRARPRAERRRSQPQHSPGPDIEALADSYYEIGGLLELTQPTLRLNVHPTRLSSSPRRSHSGPNRYDHGLGYDRPLEVGTAGVHNKPQHEQRTHADHAFNSSSTQAAGNAYTSEPRPPGPPLGGVYRPPHPWVTARDHHSPPHLFGGPPAGVGSVELEEQP